MSKESVAIEKAIYEKRRQSQGGDIVVYMLADFHDKLIYQGDIAPVNHWRKDYPTILGYSLYVVDGDDHPDFRIVEV